MIILIIVLFGFLLPYYHPPKLFFSKNPKEPWNSDYTPKIFMHIADIHISFYLGMRTNGSTDYFEDFLDYKPDLILIQEMLLIITKKVIGQKLVLNGK